MYAFIRGKLVIKNPAYVVIEAGGVGYHINISLNTFSLLDNQEACMLYTWLYVKEDAHMLYGFASEDERRIFLHLISVSGIGPNTARMVLSSVNTDEIQDAIINGNVALIQKIKGIGPKSAQRLILELQDKMRREGASSPARASSASPSVKDEALSALVMLGFTRNAAEKVLDHEMKKANGQLSVEQLIKYALKSL